VILITLYLAGAKNTDKVLKCKRCKNNTSIWHYYLTKHQKLYNMTFMDQIRFYDFIQVLHIKRRYLNTYDYFSKYNQFTTI
jgi:hypothetical protein